MIGFYIRENDCIHELFILISSIPDFVFGSFGIHSSREEVLAFSQWRISLIGYMPAISPEIHAEIFFFIKFLNTGKTIRRHDPGNEITKSIVKAIDH